MTIIQERSEVNPIMFRAGSGMNIDPTGLEAVCYRRGHDGTIVKVPVTFVGSGWEHYFKEWEIDDPMPAFYELLVTHANGYKATIGSEVQFVSSARQSG